jgi:hypothetical protein
VPGRPKWPRPEIQLREFLAASRRAGATFDEAWAAALNAPSSRGRGIRLPHATRHRKAILEVFKSGKAEWRAAYEGIETPTSRVLKHIAEAFGTDDWSTVARVVSHGASVEAGARLARVPIGYVKGSAGSPDAVLREWPETHEIAA